MFEYKHTMFMFRCLRILETFRCFRTHDCLLLVSIINISWAYCRYHTTLFVSTFGLLKPSPFGAQDAVRNTFRGV